MGMRVLAKSQWMFGGRLPGARRGILRGANSAQMLSRRGVDKWTGTYILVGRRSNQVGDV